MSKIGLLFLIVAFLTISICGQTGNSNYCDEIKYIPASSKPTFRSMLTGVKYAFIIISPTGSSDIPAFKAFFEYLEAIGFQAKYIDPEYEQDHLDEAIYTAITYDYSYGTNKYSKIRWHFVCPSKMEYRWEFSSNKTVRSGSDDYVQKSFYNILREMYPNRKPTYNERYRIQLPKRKTCWNEYSIKQDFQNNGVDRYEGIYENSSANGIKYRLALKRMKEAYFLIYLSGASNAGNWEEGEIKASLIPTATPQFYKAKWIMKNKSENDGFYITFDKGMITVIDGEKNENLYVKMYPFSSNSTPSYKDVPDSGTGFAITSNGLIVTNYHVIDGAKTIKVRGVNSDFTRAYSAKVVVADKNNDLAIIKIDGFGFSSLGTVPYIIKSSPSNVGENIFVLGYPLRATMGDEVKLTNGIISSNSGFQGDITSYQISAPVQPGNSGGPLFNNKGQIIGIIKATHLGAQNASYAVKSSYLTTLINFLDYPPKLQKVSSVSGKTLSQQVQIIKKFIYIIEVN